MAAAAAAQGVDLAYRRSSFFCLSPKLTGVIARSLMEIARPEWAWPIATPCLAIWLVGGELSGEERLHL